MEQLSALIPQFLLDEISARGAEVIKPGASDQHLDPLIQEVGPLTEEVGSAIGEVSTAENGAQAPSAVLMENRDRSEETPAETFPLAPGQEQHDREQQDQIAELVSLFRTSWDDAKALLARKVDPGLFLAWIKPLVFLDVTTKLTADVETYAVVLGAPNRFSTEHVTRRYSSAIVESLAAAVGLEPSTGASIISLRVTVGRGQPVLVSKGAGPSAISSPSDSAAVNSLVPGSPAPGLKGLEDSRSPDRSIVPDTSKAPVFRNEKSHSETEARKTAVRKRDADSLQANECGLNPKYNFSNFVVGGCNQFAHAICLRVSEDLGGNYNPLFIYGGVGLGKTHLANAIGNASRRRGKRVLLVSSELFVSELIAALRSNKMQQFKNRFRSLDLLIVDDIQFIIGKERTQEEFFHTFNELHQKHKQIVMTSDKMPQDLIGLEERLKTRFASGISADLQAPDFETRVAILIRKSEQASIQLPVEVARLLAERIDTNVRELEGALNRIQAFSSLYQEPITVDLAQSVLKTVAPEKNREVSPEQIQRLVGERFSIGLSDIIGKRRTQNIALARQVAMYLCRKLTPSSYPEIGALFGGRDHSTVIHANKVIEERIRTDEQFGKDVQAIERRLRG